MKGFTSSNTQISLAEFTVNMNGSRDWSGFTAYTNSLTGRSYLNYTTPGTVQFSSKMASRPAPTGTISNVPGIIGSTYTLYAPKVSGTKLVKICTIATMDNGCSGGITIKDNTSGIYNGYTIAVTTVTKDGAAYWKVSGLRDLLAVTGI
jgi:hypothetical protein